MGWPQYIMIILIAGKTLSLISAAKGYKAKEPSDAIKGASVVSVPVIWGGVLYWGGFFG